MQKVPDDEGPATPEESTDDSEDYSDLGQDFVRMLFSS
jgi:hypothetical protein